MELEDALFAAQKEDKDCLIEVESSIDGNANFHSILRKFALQTAETTIRLLSASLSQSSIKDDFFYFKVAPLEIHRANLEDAENQRRFLMHAMKGVKSSCFLSLLKGSFSRWIWNELGILVSFLICIAYIIKGIKLFLDQFITA
ncbi:protein PHYLLO, chloroplastic-like [Neltuma alba]|uniref:protein PHYLLO, chloroplastic-like n=1 Tax=Neltuma alba TaxID=207710 RepID=UPI0010A3D52F|nr:protein PHYLLO, chloroplastic-like [Prosopis alba]